MTGPPVLEAIELFREVGSGRLRQTILRGVSLRVEPSQFVAITGPSGSGKSTLLVTLGLLAAASSGELRYHGAPAPSGAGSNRWRRRYRARNIGFVFQKPNLLPFLTAQENVELGLEYAGAPRRERAERARRLLCEMGLETRVDHLPRQLSGGEQQRVAIARALANAPKLVLADEPTAALDAARSRQIMETLRRLSREHAAAVIVVTHDHRSLDLCDRIFKMTDGVLTLADDNRSAPTIP